MNPKRILVATDFSPAAELAVERAATLAKMFQAELRLLHIVPPQRWFAGLFASRKEWSAQVRGSAAAALKERASRVADEVRIEVSTALLSGSASSVIVGAAADYRPDLLAIGVFGAGHPANNSTGLGHTASKLIGTTKTPLLLVRHASPAAPKNVLAALDLTPASVRVARWARFITKGQANYLHVFEAPFTQRLQGYGVSRKTLDVYATEQLAERDGALRRVLLEAGLSQRTPRLVLRGEAAKIIGAQVRKLKIDTLVVGKHSRRKRDATSPYGSVCHHVAYFSPSDVLVVP
jgi:universal stress protein E